MSERPKAFSLNRQIMNKYAIIAAGGTGLRMESPIPKQFLLLMGKPVLWHSVDTFLKAYEELEIVLVLPETRLAEGQAILSANGSPDRVRILAGGPTRFHSVKKGLTAVPVGSVVFIHDAVRCLLSIDLIHRCHDQALKSGNAVPAISAVDSIRLQEGEDNRILEREKIKIIQTPQTFLSDLIKKAYEQEYNATFTDEASVLESTGVRIQLVDGENTNIKITRAADFFLAEKILEGRNC
jgi:2-C-methyl-D-erythritol 4-phosphate cytidylyltransferase